MFVCYGYRKSVAGSFSIAALRHTFAKTMEDAGAKVSDMQARLGHTSLAVTGRSLARRHASDNRHLGDLSRFYGVPVDADDDEDATHDETHDEDHHLVTHVNT